MPGILPMKVIKVGNNAQTRIAQACDRCRSKKIRCDGIRPTCSQCITVGFECKTSDKLSRRAFPRGYTESLEERVRALETEVRDLKTLLDEKDEKIDMLSRIHSNSQSHSPGPRRKSATTIAVPPQTVEEKAEEKDDLFRIMQSPCLVDDEEADAYFVGTSSGRQLIDAFKTKLQETGKPSAEFNTKAFIPSATRPCAGTVKPQTVCWQAPARIISDQLINIFFQEWAPLYPILHRPTFLILYEQYVSCPEDIDDKTLLAELNLVFAIAAQSSETPFHHEIDSFNSQWEAALEERLMDNTAPTLQCLLLAQIACLQSGDYARLVKYKGLAIGLAQRLGLHQSQKRFTFGALTAETRKKLFWTLYTLDCFTAAQLGQPRLLKDEDIHCEYPVDADDEYITEEGFLPTLPGEFTKLSSALALFKVSRILAKVLAENYPASYSYDISSRKLMSLSDELDDWSKNLPHHLRLQFVQDKPSTNIVSSRSPLVSLAYHYIRSLIYRPAVCASSASAAMSGTAKVTLATSSKCIVQIVQLLTERSLSFSFCLNKNELLIASGFGLLFQNLDLEFGSALMKENQRLIFVIANMLDRQPSRASVEYRRVSTGLAMQHLSSEPRKLPVLSRHNSDGNLSAPQDTMSSAQKHMRSIVSRFSSGAKGFRPDEQRATLPVVSYENGNSSRTSLSSIRSEPAGARSEPTLSPPVHRSSLSPPKPSKRASSTTSCNASTNLDYLPLGSVASTITSRFPYGTAIGIPSLKTDSSDTDWERLLSSLDNGQTSIYDGIYGGPAIDALADVPPLPPPSDGNLVWSPDVWAVGAEAPQSVLSFSDESLTSGEEFAELTNCASNESYRGILIPEMSPGCVDGFGMGGLDGGFGM